jgi:hypothetical protein
MLSAVSVEYGKAGGIRTSLRRPPRRKSSDSKPTESALNPRSRVLAFVDTRDRLRYVNLINGVDAIAFLSCPKLLIF